MRGWAPVLGLLGVGAAWGLAVPLTRVAVSTGHQPLGLTLWQQVIAATALALVLRAMRLPLGLAWRHAGVYALVALLGTVLPGYFTFLTAAHLPAGVRAILLASVPMFVLPMALAMGFERPQARRAMGVLLGAGAIALIALPGSEASGSYPVTMTLLTLVAPVSYAVETTYLAWRGGVGLHPVQLLFGASLAGIAVSGPLAVAAGQTVDLARAWGPAEAAVLASSLLHTTAYVGYVWLIARTGSVFASQIAYLITAFGVAWSWALLGERYGPFVWLAFAVMLGGVALIRPQPVRAETA